MMVESVCFRLWEESFWIKVENRCHLEQKVWKSLPPSVAKICFRIACDVDNPLYGEKGCSYIFGPQKGATPEMVELMDGWMENYAKITEEYFADSKTQLGKFNYDPNYPGCGAAGGRGGKALTEW